MSDRLLTSHAFTGPAREGLNRRANAWWLVLSHSYRATVSRRELAALDDRLLADIGVSQADALAEAGRAPWDLGPPRPPATSSNLDRKPGSGSIWQAILAAARRQRSRRRIAQLDAAALKDIGVTFAEAEA